MATIFYTKLEADSKVSKLLSRSNDIARSLGLPDDSVRISGNIEGERNTIGIELPNPKRSFCSIRAVLEHQSYSKSSHSLPLALGIGIDGEYVCEDLSALPHLLLAGSTGSGKTVALNAILLSLIYKKSPAELNLVLIDPKMVEFSLYKGIPHLLGNVVTDMDESVQILHELVEEMELRYQKFQDVQVTKIADYNESAGDRNKMPHIVVFVDELGDLMLSHGKRVEDLLGRLSQKARAAGIHLVLATQRPSVDVITGLIKANIPTRIAFQVSTKIDSRTILDQGGAEQLLGYGDMLYLPPGVGVPVRVHGAFVGDDEVHRVVNDWKSRAKPNYVEEIVSSVQDTGPIPGWSGADIGSPEDADELYDEAVNFVLESRRASISAVQRKLRIGYNRAARLIETMEEAGIVSEMSSNGSREVLVPKRD